MSAAGVGAVIGAVASSRLGERWGTGRAMVASRVLQPVAVALVALSPAVAGTDQGLPLPWPLQGSLASDSLWASKGRWKWATARP